jgi:hypothetical protein
MRRPALTLSLLLACTANAPATPTPTVVVVEPAADAKAPAIPPPSTTPTPADPPVVADPTPPTDAPPQPPAAPADSTFQLAAHRDGDLELHRLGDEMFVVGGGGLAHADARGRLVAVEYGFTGMTAAEDWGTWNPLAFGGVWPHNAWLATQFEFSRGTSRPQLQRRDGAAWKPVANKDGVLFWYHDPMIAWREGQVLGVRRYIVDPNLSTEDAGEPTPPRIRKKIDAQLAAARHGIDVLGPTPTPATMVLDRGLDVLRLAAAPTGEVFALGSGTGEQLGEGFRVQRWGLAGDAAVAGAVHKIDKGIACAQIAVRSADEAYVGCTRGSKERAHILRFDGAAWTEEPAPAAPGILDLAVAPEGELWAVVGSEDTGADFVYGQVWRRTARGAAWQRVALPELRFADRGHDDIVFTPTSRYSRLPAEPEAAAKTWPVHPQQVLAGADGEVWIRGETYLERGEVSEFMTYRNVVLRNVEVPEPLRMLHDLDLRTELPDWRSARAWTPTKACDEDLPAFIAVRTLPRDAARNQPEPAIEALVRDHAALLPKIEGIYEFWRRGRRTIGLLVRPETQADADALLAAVAQVAPGEQRTLECRWPRARREFDMKTGKPIDAPPT